MLVVSDTHRRDGHGLPAGARAMLDGNATGSADRSQATGIIHAGDFTTAAVLESFRAFDGPLFAVHGNADADPVRSRLPPARTVRALGLTIAVTHSRPGGQQALALFGRERDADLVVSGHTHDPGIVRTPHCTLVNPGSHTGTRASRSTYATIEQGLDGDETLDIEGENVATTTGVTVAIRRADGTVLESERLEP